MNFNDIPTVSVNISSPELHTPEFISEITAQAVKFGFQWFLAHADDGVIWGEFREGQLVVSKWSPALREITLQQVRAFGKNGELLLWRNNATWFSRLIIEEENGMNTEYVEQQYLLWGDQVEATENGFSLLSQGTQGLRHALPVAIQSFVQPTMTVRHYLSEDNDGQVFVNITRLVSVQAS